MFGKKKTDSPQIDKAVSQGVSFELTLAERARRSERRAWLVASLAMLMAVILAGGYFLFLPLKEKVPYLVMADPYTGTATVARLVGNFQDRAITTEEAVNKSNVAQFIMARESYDSGLIGERNWRTTFAMAGSAVVPAYRALHAPTNPDRPFRLYGSSRAVRVQILSIVLIGGNRQSAPTGATVRFQRSIYDKSNGRSEHLDSKIATLEFSYNPDIRLSEEDRMLNPLGFRVTNYRVDNDFGSAPVPSREFPLPQSAPAAPAQQWPADSMPQAAPGEYPQEQLGDGAQFGEMAPPPMQPGEGAE